jgi:hypothetical protein
MVSPAAHDSGEAVATAKRCPGGNLAASCMNAFEELASVTFYKITTEQMYCKHA